MVALLFAFLAALVIGFAGGNRVRKWLSSIGILGTLLVLLLLSFGLAFWSSSPSFAAIDKSAIESANPILSAAQASADLRESLTSHGDSSDYEMRKNAGTSERILASASSGQAKDKPLYAAKLDRSTYLDLDASAVQRIKIPALKVDTGVIPAPFDGVTWDVSEIGGEVAWLERTSQPGLGGNTVLAGHITARDIGNGPFRYLNGLAAGESVYLFTENNLYEYRVREFRIVTDRDGSVTKATDNPQLTLVTCSSWDELANQYTKRRVVFADLIEVRSLHDTRPTYQAH